MTFYGCNSDGKVETQRQMVLNKSGQCSLAPTTVCLSFSLSVRCIRNSILRLRSLSLTGHRKCLRFSSSRISIRNPPLGFVISITQFLAFRINSLIRAATYALLAFPVRLPFFLCSVERTFRSANERVIFFNVQHYSLSSL